MNPKQISQRWFEEMWNHKKPALIAELMDESSIGITEGGEVKGPAAFRAMVYEPFVAAFPDVQVTIDGLIAENDEVVVRWTLSATHGGALMHLPPTGRRLKFSGMTWHKIRNGKIVAGSDSYNVHGVFAFLAHGTESATVRAV